MCASRRHEVAFPSERCSLDPKEKAGGIGLGFRPGFDLTDGDES
jgi:hypothetical protein